MRRLGVVTLAISVSGLVACGDHGTPAHSVRDVTATFADHGVQLAVVERDRVSTTLLPSTLVRRWRRTPALGRSTVGAGYFVVVFTDRRWLHDLSRHGREAQRTLGGSRFSLSQVSTRHDNVFIFYRPALRGASSA